MMTTIGIRQKRRIRRPRPRTQAQRDGMLGMLMAGEGRNNDGDSDDSKESLDQHRQQRQQHHQQRGCYATATETTVWSKSSASLPASSSLTMMMLKPSNAQLKTINSTPNLRRRRRRGERHRCSLTSTIHFVCQSIWILFVMRSSSRQPIPRTKKTTTATTCTTIFVSSFVQPHHVRHQIMQPSTPSSSSLSPSSIAAPQVHRSLTALEGVRGFRAWFEKQFPEATTTVDVSKAQDTFDHVLVDMNQILHVVLRKARSEGHAHKLLMMELDDLVRFARPKHSLVLAIDGAPGAAKLATQRKRRFYILKNTQFKLDHFNKIMSGDDADAIALLGSSKSRRERRLRSYQSELRSFELAPCTDRMKGFEEAILYWAWSRLNSASFADMTGRNPLLSKTTRIYFSPSSVTGEGEIKLLEWINNFQGMLERQKSPSVAFVGGDTDMVLEAMVVHPNWTHNVFVLRKSEAPPVSRSPYKANDDDDTSDESKQRVKAKAKLRDSVECTSVWEMTRLLDIYCRRNLPAEVYNPDVLLQIRTDMVILTILNGNDYLPRVPDSDFARNFQIYMTLMKRYMTEASDSNKKISMANIGIIDPNTLTFRLKFAASFFRALGVTSISPTDQLRTVQSVSLRRTYNSILNDMAAIGFVPNPVSYKIMTVEEFTKESAIDQGGHCETVRSSSEVDAEDDDFDDDEEDEEDGVDMDNEDYDEIEEEEHDQVTIKMNQTETCEENTYVLRLTLGKIGTPTFRQFHQKITHSFGPRYRFASEKNELSKIALKDADLLQYFEEGGNLTDLTPEWEIERPVAPKIDRYLAGLVWTLWTYQDGVCPNYSYNYGKRLAPTGESIARFFDRARRNGNTVGPTDLIEDAGTFSGRDVSAGASCLAALPTAMKHLVPKPFSLLEDRAVEEIYGMCVDKTDNSFDLPKFQKLLEVEIESEGLTSLDELSFQDKNSLHRDVGNGRRIVLGDHFWSVLSVSKQDIAHPFCPPPPPNEDFSILRRNNRIKASRIISIDVSRRRDATAETGNVGEGKNRFWKHVESSSYAKVDHCSMKQLIDSSGKPLIDIPYKTAFGSKGVQSELAISRKLQESKDVDSRYPSLKPSPLNRSGQNGKYVLSLLEQAGLLTGYSFDDISIGGKNPMFNVTIHVKMNGGRQWNNSILCRSKKLGVDHLASNALGAMLTQDSKWKKERWYELDFEDLKARLILQQTYNRDGSRNKKGQRDGNGKVSSTGSVNNAVEHLYRLKDIGLINECLFSESLSAEDTTNADDQMVLTIRQGTLQNGFPAGSHELKLCRIRQLGESKKITKRILSSLALDTLLHGKTKDEPSSLPTIWDTLPFDVVKSLLLEKEASVIKNTK